MKVAEIGFIVIARYAGLVPLGFVAEIVADHDPAEVGVPEITPVLVLTDRPGGKPLAPKLVG